MKPARIARVIEVLLYGGLLGTLVAVAGVRLLFLFLEMSNSALLGVLTTGAVVGSWVGFARQRDSSVVVAALRARTPWFKAVCLKAVLWLLAFAAVVGVLAVLTASYDLLGRISGTLAATAVAAAILWPLSGLLDSPKSIAAGLFGVVMTVVVYCLVMPLIWEFGYRQNELLLSSLALGLSAPFGMAAIRMTESRETRLTGRIGTLLYVMVVTCFLIASWNTDRRGQSEDWWLFGFYLVGYGTLAVACLVGLPPRVQLNWRWLGVAASVLGWSLVVFHQWGPLPMYEKGIILLVSVACGFAHTAVSFLAPLTPSQQWLRRATLGAVVVTIVFLNLEVFLPPDRSRDLGMLGRIAGAAGVVASCGSLALIVLLRLNQRGTVVKADEEMVSVVLHCPGCGKKQTIKLGGDDCRHCGLRISVEVDRTRVENDAGGQRLETAAPELASTRSPWDNVASNSPSNPTPD